MLGGGIMRIGWVIFWLALLALILFAAPGGQW